MTRKRLARIALVPYNDNRSKGQRPDEGATTQRTLAAKDMAACAELSGDANPVLLIKAHRSNDWSSPYRASYREHH